MQGLGELVQMTAAVLRDQRALKRDRLAGGGERIVIAADRGEGPGELVEDLREVADPTRIRRREPARRGGRLRRGSERLGWRTEGSLRPRQNQQRIGQQRQRRLRQSVPELSPPRLAIASVALARASLNRPRANCR